MTVDGETLEHRLERGRLSLAELAPIVEDALECLVSAQRENRVIRDITPATLFIEKCPADAASRFRRERTRIIDRGACKPPTRRPPPPSPIPDLRSLDASLATFAYMAPEQVRSSARVDGRVDTYALGAIVFRALTGKLPFEGMNALTLVALKMERAPPSLTQTTNTPWPAGLERFVATMMALDRHQRFPTALEALAAWRKLTLS